MYNQEDISLMQQSQNDVQSVADSFVFRPSFLRLYTLVTIGVGMTLGMGQVLNQAIPTFPLALFLASPLLFHSVFEVTVVGNSVSFFHLGSFGQTTISDPVVDVIHVRRYGGPVVRLRSSSDTNVETWIVLLFYSESDQKKLSMLLNVPPEKPVSKELFPIIPFARNHCSYWREHHSSLLLNVAYAVASILLVVVSLRILLDLLA